MQFAVEYQQFDVLVMPDKKGLGTRFVNWVKNLISEQKERFKQNLALYFAACVLNCCGLPLSNLSVLPAPKSLDALQLVLAVERLSKLRQDFESYLDKADFYSSTKHEVSILKKYSVITIITNVYAVIPKLGYSCHM